MGHRLGYGAMRTGRPSGPLQQGPVIFTWVREILESGHVSPGGNHQPVPHPSRQIPYEPKQPNPRHYHATSCTPSITNGGFVSWQYLSPCTHEEYGNGSFTWDKCYHYNLHVECMASVISMWHYFKFAHCSMLQFGLSAALYVGPNCSVLHFGPNCNVSHIGPNCSVSHFGPHCSVTLWPKLQCVTHWPKVQCVTLWPTLQCVTLWPTLQCVTL